MKAWLLSLILIPALALGQTYTPLQPGHHGNWFDPSAVGEGIELAVHDNDQRSISGEAFLIGPSGPVWFGIAGDWATAWRPVCGDYELVAFARDEVNGVPYPVGSVWLKPIGHQLSVVILANAGEQWFRAGTFQRLTRPPGLSVGVCNWNGFHPRPPQAPDGWCHDDPPEYPAPTWCPH